MKGGDNMERYVIVAFNPDGTENFLEWSNDFDYLWKVKNQHMKRERKQWLKDGGEYCVMKVIRSAQEEVAQ